MRMRGVVNGDSVRWMGRAAMLLSLAGGLGLGGLSGCSRAQLLGSDGPSDEPPAPLASFTANADDWRTAGYRQDWVGYPFPTASGANMVREIAVYADTVVAQDKSSVVSLLEGTTGARRWSNELATPLTKFVGITRDPVDANRLVVSSESEAFLLASPTGDLTNRERLPRVVNTPAVISEGLAIYGSPAGEVVAHRLGMNLKAWGFLSQGSILATPVLVGGAVGSVSQEGDVVFLEPNSGRLLGRTRIAGGLLNNPVAEGDTMYIAGQDQSVWAIANNGRVRWRYRTPARLSAQPAIIEGTLYVEVPGDGLTAIDGATGVVRWANREVTGNVIARNGSRLVVFGGGAVTLVDAAKGAKVASFNTPGITRLVADQMVDGNLFGVTDTNLVVKFSRR